MRSDSTDLDMRRTKAASSRSSSCSRRSRSTRMVRRRIPCYIHSPFFHTATLMPTTAPPFRPVEPPLSIAGSAGEVSEHGSPRSRRPPGADTLRTPARRCQRQGMSAPICQRHTLCCHRHLGPQPSCQRHCHTRPAMATTTTTTIITTPAVAAIVMAPPPPSHSPRLSSRRRCKGPGVQ